MNSLENKNSYKCLKQKQKYDVIYYVVIHIAFLLYNLLSYYASFVLHRMSTFWWLIITKPNYLYSVKCTDW